MLSGSMPFHKRTYGPGQLQLTTTSTYWRAPLFLSELFCRGFAGKSQVRKTLGRESSRAEIKGVNVMSSASPDVDRFS
jgi:hypothetical protein